MTHLTSLLAAFLVNIVRKFGQFSLSIRIIDSARPLHCCLSKDITIQRYFYTGIFRCSNVNQNSGTDKRLSIADAHTPSEHGNNIIIKIKIRIIGIIHLTEFIFPLLRIAFKAFMTVFKPCFA